MLEVYEGLWQAAAGGGRVKILALSNLYPPDFIGGYEIACAQVVDALRLRGHDVLVATAAPRSHVPTVEHVRRVFRLVDEWNPDFMGTERIILELNGAESRLINAYNVHALTVVLEEFAPDVVFVSNIVGLGGLGLMACLQYLKVPWVWHLGDCVPRMLCTEFWIFDRVHPTLSAEFSRQLRGHYIAVSQQLRDEIEASGVLLHGSVEVIPYWIVGEPRRLARCFAPGETLRIMSAGQVTREKGADLLIEAAGRLRDAGHRDFRLDIYGQVDDPYFAHLIHRLDLNAHVSLMGVRPHRELLGLYGEYDVFAFPSRDREPFGLVPLEASARGCVPLITRRCGIAEWLVHGVHCLKAARTPDAFADALASMLDGKVDLASIGRRGADVVGQDFHIDAIALRVEGILECAGGWASSQCGHGRRGFPHGPACRTADRGDPAGTDDRGIGDGWNIGLEPSPKNHVEGSVAMSPQSPDIHASVGLKRSLKRLIKRLARPLVGRQLDVLYGLFGPCLEPPAADRCLNARLENIEARLVQAPPVDSDTVADLANRVEARFIFGRSIWTTGRLRWLKAFHMTNAFGWDYVALVRRLASIEDQLAETAAPADSSTVETTKDAARQSAA